MARKANNKGLRQLLPGRPAVALCVYLFYMVALTLSPFQFTRDAEWGATLFSLRNIDGEDIVLNTIGFGVLGIILYWLRPGRERVWLRLGVAVCCAAALSATVEILQGYMPERDATFLDFLANTAGGGLGFLLAHHAHRRSWHLRLAPLRKPLALVGIASYAAGLFLLYLAAGMPQKLDSWDRGFPLLIGNEATMDRPWLGSVSSVMIFDRALDQREAGALFAAGRSPGPAVEREYQPVIAYRFDEGTGDTAHDTSQSGEPADLRIASPDLTAWLPEGGIRLRGPTVLRSAGAGEKLYRRIAASDAFSVSVWFQPEGLEQHGPARIVSFSKTPFTRNFTIGQEGADLHFRVRDLLSGKNGLRFGAVETPGGVRSVEGPVHGVFVYEKGAARVYLDGELAREAYPLDWFAVIAWFLHFDLAVPWQKWMLAGLLIGGVGILLWPLALPRDG